MAANHEQLRKNLETSKLPRGKYSQGVISQYIYPGNIVVIERTPGIEETYVSVGSRGSSNLLNIDTSQFVPVNDILAGEISIRNATQVERQNVTSRHPEIKMRDEMVQELNKNPEVKGLSIREITLDASQYQHAGHTKPETPQAVFTRIADKVYKKANTEQASRILVEKTRMSYTAGIINHSALDQLESDYRSAGMTESHDFQDFHRIKDRLGETSRKLHDAISSISRDQNQSNLLKTVNTLKGKTQYGDYTYSFKDTTDFNRITFSNNIPDVLAKETKRAYQAFDSAAAKEKNIVSWGSEGQKYSRLLYKHSQREQVVDLVEYLNKYNLGHSINQTTLQAGTVTLARGIAGSDGTYGVLKKLYQSSLANIDLQTGTEASKTSYMQTPGLFGMMSTQDIHAIAQTKAAPTEGSSIISAGLQKDSNSISYINNEIDIGRLFGVSDNTIKAYSDITAGNAAREANSSRHWVEDDILRRRIEEISPTHQTYSSRNRTPKDLKLTTGMLQVVSGVMGIYFYQNMMHSWTRKVVNIYNQFGDPGQIIEAKKHSSVETSVRRLMTTDFGSKWDYAKTFIEHLVLGAGAHGEASQAFGKFTRFVKKYGFDEAGKLDLVKGWGAAKDYLRGRLTSVTSRYLQNQKSLTSSITKEIHTATDQYFKYIADHPKQIIIGTSAAFLMSRVGPSRAQQEDKKFINTRKKNVSQSEVMRYNSVNPEGQYSSPMNVEGRVMAGFASPINLETVTRAMGPILAGVKNITSKVSMSQMENMVEGRGFQFNEIMSAQTKAGALRLPEAIMGRGRIISGAPMTNLAQNEMVADIHKEFVHLQGAAQSAAMPRQMASKITHIGKTAQMNKELAATGEMVMSRTGIAKEQPIVNMNKESFHKRPGNEVSIEPTWDLIGSDAKHRSLRRKLPQAIERSISNGKPSVETSVELKRTASISRNKIGKIKPRDPQYPVISTTGSSKDLVIDHSMSFPAQSVRKSIPEANLKLGARPGAQRAYNLAKAEDRIMGTAYSKPLYEPRHYQASYRTGVVDMNGMRPQQPPKTLALQAHADGINQAGFKSHTVSNYANGKTYSDVLKREVARVS